MNFNGINSFTEQDKLFIERTGNTFSYFYKKYHPKLIYYTSRMCPNPQKAEDVTIESFMTAFEKIDKYEKEKSQFSTWLFTIARNIMLQEIKVDKRMVSIDVEIDEEGTPMSEMIPEETSDEHIIDLQSRKADIILKYIDKLKQPYKEVIEMRELKNMSYKEISDKLNININTLKSRIKNGRAMLIRASRKEFDILDDMY